MNPLFYQRILRSFLWLGGGLLLLLLLISWLVTVPAVQSFLVRKSSTWLEARIGVPVELQQVDVALPDRAVLRGLSICDQQGQPLLELEELRFGLLNFSLWAYLFDHRAVQTLQLNDLSLLGPEVRLYRRPDGTLNLTFLLDALRGSDREEASGNLPFNLSFPSISLKEGSFSYRDSTQLDPAAAFTGLIDYQDLAIEALTLLASFELDTAGQVAIDLKHLSLYERQADWTLDTLRLSLHGDVPDSSGILSTWIDDLTLRADSTHLQADLAFEAQSLDELLAFDDRFRYEVSFRDGNRVHFRTLSTLVGDSLPLAGVVHLSGRVGGTLHSLSSPILEIAYRNDTRLRTFLSMKQIQRASDTRLDLRFAESSISMIELRQMLPEVGLPPLLESLGVLELSGSFRGGYYNFRTVATTDTEQGMLSADLQLTLPPETPLITYRGRLFTQHLNLNALGLSESPLSRDFNFSGKIEGQGVSIDEADLALDARLIASDLMGYRIDSAMAKVNIEQRKVAGKVFAHDGRGLADLIIDLDLNQTPASYVAKGRIEDVDLLHYGFFDDSATFSTQLDIDLRGDSVDGLQGYARLAKLTFTRPGKKPFRLRRLDLQTFDDLAAISKKHLVIQSPVLLADFVGDFTYERVGRFIQRQITETNLFLSNDTAATRAYYDAKVPEPDTLQLNIGLQPLDSLGAFLTYFDMPSYFSPGLAVEAVFKYIPPGADSASVSQDVISLKIEDQKPGADQDSLYVAGVGLLAPELDIIFVKRGNTSELLLGFEVYSEVFYPTPALRLSDLNVSFNGSGMLFTGDVALRQEDADATAQLRTRIDFAPEGFIRIGLDSESYLKVRGDSLGFAQTGEIILGGDSITINHLRLSNQTATRSFSAAGVLSASPSDSLVVEIDSLDLATFNKLMNLGYRFDGIYDAHISVLAGLGNARLNLNSRLDGLAIDRYPYGDLALRSDYLTDQEVLDISADLIHEGDTNLMLSGQYRLESKDSPLDFRLRTKRGFPLGYLTPFVAGQLAELDGRVGLDQFTITGTPEHPQVAGRGRFEETSFVVDYFRTQYQLTGQILVDNQRITLQDMRLADPKNPLYRASLHGDVLHENFQDFRLDLKLDSTRNFLLMNTRKEDNELFYGKLILQQAIADLQGDPNNIELTSIAAFAPNSVLRLPLSDDAEYGRPDFITFASEADDQARSLNTGLTGFDLNITALLTENLEVELIFDERVGDIIRGRGEGNINMKVDESGTFSMYGRYEVQQGDYLFTSQNVINKKFEVVPGGSIVWTGDPYDAQIDIQARYPVMADIRDIVGAENAIRVPTNVLMHMQGSLEQPEISLSIELNNLSEGYVSEVASYVRSIQYDEQELNKQVFSLMVFNRFAPAGLTGQLASTGVTTSISEMLSNQLNYLLSSFTQDNLNVNLNASNFQDVNLMLSYRFFNERITIERDGGLPWTNNDSPSGQGNPNDTQAQDQLSSLIGDVSIVIRLLPNPKKESNQIRPSELVLEVFNRNTVTQDGSGTNASTQTGLGIFYKKDFDRLQEILRRRKRDRDTTRR